MSADFSPKAMLQKNRLGMRKSFGLWMEEMAEEHDDLMVIAADVASSAGLQGFAQRFPEKFLNVGIAEQNMAGIAAGLAKEGSNVFIVSFAPFVTMRAYEALRTLVGYMHLNVKAVSLASGFSLGVQGNTHYCLEDISLVKTIPGMLLLSPADCLEEGKCLEYLLDYQGPAFLRITGIISSGTTGGNNGRTFQHWRVRRYGGCKSGCHASTCAPFEVWRGRGFSKSRGLHVSAGTDRFECSKNA